MAIRYKLLLFCVFSVLWCSAAPKWTFFRSPGGNFRIELPGAPQQSERMVNTPSGSLKMNIYSFDGTLIKGENRLYLVTYSDYPEKIISSSKRKGVIDTFLKNAIDGAVNNIHGKLVSSVPAKINQYPGMAVRASFSGDKGFMDIRLYLVKNRLYMLEVGSQKGQSNEQSGKRFFRSFSLIPPPGKK